MIWIFIWIAVSVIGAILAGRFIRVGSGFTNSREFTPEQIDVIEANAKARRP